MARNESQFSSLPPQIAQIVATLSNRPDVQSTIILSRESGSIICASGTLSQDVSKEVLKRQSYESPQTTSVSQFPSLTEASAPTDATAELAPEEFTYGQKLAASIMTFVTAGEGLGGNLEGLTPESTQNNLRRKMTFSDDKQTGTRYSVDGEDGVSNAVDHELQLLRLRTKAQEIIIYPDQKYLCCVVQSTGKYGT